MQSIKKNIYTQARQEGRKGGKVFPGPATPSLKSTEKGVPDGFSLTSNMHKSIFGRGSAPDPAGRVYDVPQWPRSVIEW